MTSADDNVAFVLAACGETHAQRSELSIRSIRRFTNRDVVVVASRCVPRHVDASVIHVNVPHHLNDAQAGRYSKTGLFRFLPSGRRYCYIDNDVFVVSSQAGDVFQVHDAPVLFGPCSKKSVANVSHDATRGIPLPDAIRNRFGLRIDPTWPLWNSGVYVFDDAAHSLNPLRPRAFGGKGAEGMKKEIPISRPGPGKDIDESSLRVEWTSFMLPGHPAARQRYAGLTVVLTFEPV